MFCGKLKVRPSKLRRSKTLSFVQVPTRMNKILTSFYSDIIQLTMFLRSGLIRLPFQVLNFCCSIEWCNRILGVANLRGSWEEIKLTGYRVAL